MSGYQKPRRKWRWDLGFYEAQPSWSKKLFWFVGFPAWLAWGAFIVTDTVNTYQGPALATFGIFAIVAAIGNFYWLKGRGEIDR